LSALKAPPRRRRQFTASVRIDGPLEGGLADWPPKIQDGIYKALEKVERDKNVKLDILHALARCDDPQEGWYIHVVAVERRGVIIQ
jgi:hypothetical protein